MKRIVISFILIFTALSFFVYLKKNQTDIRSNASLDTPSVYSGAYVENVENDFGRLTSWESQVGKPVSLVMFFHYWIEGDFPTSLMNTIRNHGSIPVVSWEPFDESGQQDTSWGRIASGGQDGYVRKWAQDSKAWGHPYFLRFSWEMNGYWNPYANQYENYIPMWKHVRDVFNQEGASNVTWVWCPNIEGYSTRPMEKFYPGSDSVDWVCMDGYNFGTSQSWSSWQSFGDLFSATYSKLGSIAPQKPIMIGEFASGENGGVKPDWIRDAFMTQIPNKFPNVKAIVWFDINKETDWRVNSSEASRIAYAQSIASNYYAANTFGNIESTPIQPLTPVGQNYTAPIKQYPTQIPSPLPSPTNIIPTPSVIKITPIPCAFKGLLCGPELEQYAGSIKTMIGLFCVISVGVVVFFTINKRSRKKRK